MVSSDDGLNAANPDATQQDDAPGGMRADGGMGAGGPGGGDDADDTCVIVINGGTVRVNAQGDGIDSNGSLTVNGGTVLVSGPTGQGDGALDYESSATINGGTVIAAGSSGMAVSFTQGTQAYALINAAGNAGDEISIVDSSGNVVAAFAPAKAFECVVVSSPVFADSDSCSVAVGGQTYNADSGQSGTAARREPIANGGLSAKPTE